MHCMLNYYKLQVTLTPPGRCGQKSAWDEFTAGHDRQVSEHAVNRSVNLHTEPALLFCIYLPQTGQR